MELSDKNNKSKIAVVVVGYNRINSIKRVLGSLSKAHYSVDAPLVISIDASGCLPLYEFVKSFEWKHGDKYVIIREKRMGLRDHILSCGDLTKYFKGVIILEDDIYVSEYYYDYTLQAVAKYDSEDRVSGISLYRPEMDGNLPIDYIQDGQDVFAYQNVESWGECWTERMWCQFREWYRETPDHDFSKIDMPEHMKNWKKAWSKFYMAFQIETGRYFIYPSISLTTCFSEAGEHGITSSIGQVNLLSGPKRYLFDDFDNLTQYDIYGTNKNVYKWVGLDENELCVDFHGTNDNLKGRRYILSPYSYNCHIVKQYPLSLRPIELNVICADLGNGICLYDTHKRHGGSLKRGFPLTLAYYYVRQFNVKVLLKYSFSYLKSRLSDKIKSRF